MPKMASMRSEYCCYKWVEQHRMSIAMLAPSFTSQYIACYYNLFMLLPATNCSSSVDANASPVRPFALCQCPLPTFIVNNFTCRGFPKIAAGAFIYNVHLSLIIKPGKTCSIRESGSV